jgi:hypothetical protein
MKQAFGMTEVKEVRITCRHGDNRKNGRSPILPVSSIFLVLGSRHGNKALRLTGCGALPLSGPADKEPPALWERGRERVIIRPYGAARQVPVLKKE